MRELLRILLGCSFAAFVMVVVLVLLFGLNIDVSVGYSALALALALLGLPLGLAGLFTLARLVRWGRTPARPTRDLSAGIVCVTGVVEAAGARVEGGDVVAFWERRSPLIPTEAARHAACPFLLRDPTGVVLVDPGPAILAGATERQDLADAPDAHQTLARRELNPGSVALVRGRAVRADESSGLPGAARTAGVDWVVRAEEGVFAVGSERELLEPLLRWTLFLLPTALGLLTAAYVATRAALW